MLTLDSFFKILSYEEVVDFGKNQNNRQVKPNHVNDFINIIKEKNYSEEMPLAYGVMPIVVNPKTNHVLDGQHKLEAFKKAHENGLIDSRFKILIANWYVEDEAAEREIIIMLNSNSKNWSVDDYMASYAQTNDYYAMLKEFCRTHSLCQEIKCNSNEPRLKYRYGAAIVKGIGCQRVLKQEKFTVTEEELAVANVIHDEMEQIRKKLGIDKVGQDIEPMALEWRTQRQFITKDEILALSLTQQIKEKKPKNRAEWAEMFSLLKDRKQKLMARVEAA